MQTKDILKYRGIWMAFAMLWVMLFHTTNQCNNIIDIVRRIGYGGTDIFLFSSGLGIYGSLNRDDDLYHYIRRRFTRLMPMYWFFLIPWTMIKYYTSGISVKDIIGNIFCLQYISGSEGPCVNWYWTIIWIAYLIAPFLFLLVKKCESWFSYICLLVVGVLAVIPFWSDPYLNMGFSRIPIFLEGMVFGKLLMSRKVWQKRNIIGLICASCAGLLTVEYLVARYYWQAWLTGMLWYPMLLLVPGLCIGLSILAGSLEKHGLKKLLDPFQRIGNHTLEIFLVHVMLVEFFRDYVLTCHEELNKGFYWMLLYLANALGSICLYYIMQKLRILYGICKRKYRLCADEGQTRDRSM